MGASESVAWRYFGSVESSILQLKENDYQIWGVEQTTQSMPLDQVSWKREKIALVLGNEVNGLSEEVLPLLDLAIEVPQFGTKHRARIQGGNRRNFYDHRKRPGGGRDPSSR